MKQYLISLDASRLLLVFTIIAAWAYLLMNPMNMENMPAGNITKNTTTIHTTTKINATTSIKNSTTVPMHNMAHMNMPTKNKHIWFNTSKMASWILMVIAMMGVFLFPAFAYIRANSLPEKHITAFVLFSSVWLFLWACVGIIFSFIPTLVWNKRQLFFTGITFLIAAIWNISQWRKKAVNDCCRTISLYPRGKSFFTSIGAFGLVQGWACIRTCWALMLIMVISPAPTLAMICLTPVGILERKALNPKKTAHIIGLILAIIGLTLCIYSLIQVKYNLANFTTSNNYSRQFIFPRNKACCAA